MDTKKATTIHINEWMDSKVEKKNARENIQREKDLDWLYVCVYVTFIFHKKKPDTFFFEKIFGFVSD